MTIKMRIAILGSVALPIPPPTYGGIEWIAYYQAEGLVKRGHRVLLFASANSKTSAALVPVGKGDVIKEESRAAEVEASRKLNLELSYLTSVAGELINRKDDYDLVLANMRGSYIFYPLVKHLAKKFIFVLHLPLFPELIEVFRKENIPLISISNSQRKPAPKLNWLGTVYNGVDPDVFKFSPKQEDYFFTMGSIGPNKNQLEAILAAKKAGVKLVIAGEVKQGREAYFEELKSHIDGKQIQFVGSLGLSEKIKYYQGARAFLFPVRWQEPFGLVMIEAMACGTPVIAYPNGAVTEVLVDRKTGFIVENISQMVEAIKIMRQCDNATMLKLRENCRRHVKENFTVEKMVDAYEKSCQEALLKDSP